jgi:NAD(P)-dependent dehydrogenase (short-subunit alcohol dehydrogenase family)
MSEFLAQRANLSGKVAVVLGGAGGIGKAVSLALANAGVDVAICDRDGDAADSAREEFRALGQEGFVRVVDVTQPAALADFYAEVAASFARLDIVVNVVGGVRQRPFLDATPDHCAADIQRNYGYVLDSVRHAVPLIRRGARGGSIINFTTIEASRGAAGFAVYAGAKAAVANFSRALAVELAAERIRVNCVAPDTTPSRGNAEALPPETAAAMARMPDKMADALKMYVPIGAPPEPTDLADAVLFLASDLSRMITGTSLHVDGGTWAASGFINWPFGGGYLPVPPPATLEHLR